MNYPRGRDTVTSTKATTSKTMSTTKTTSGTVDPISLSTTNNNSASTTMARKRRQLTENRSLQRCSASSHRSPDATGATSPSPEKSRRRTDRSIPHRSRLGDFFSNLACRLRGSSKNSESTSRRERSCVRKVTSTESSVSHRSDSALPSMKREMSQINEASSLQLSSSCSLGSSHVTSCSSNKKRRIGDLTPTITASEDRSTLAQQARSLEAMSNDASNTNTSGQETSITLMTETETSNTATSEACTASPSDQTSQGDDITSSGLSLLDKIVESESEIGNNCYNTALESNSGSLNHDPKVTETLNETESQQKQQQQAELDQSTISCEREQAAPLLTGSEPAMQEEPPMPQRLTASASAGSTIKRPVSSGRGSKDEVARLRATIQWLEEGARRLREELAMARAQLHEERRATKLVRRQIDTAVREARGSEAAKYSGLLADLRNRREMGALKNRLSEAEATIQKLKASSIDRGFRTVAKNKEDEAAKAGNLEIRKLEAEVQSLRATCRMLEEKLHVSNNHDN
ncbi:hypothetical protein QAD02_008750 [Eretmocerus hayati]|uniref:Uncharacterized protein n=1 Tax=Eretmocerus hayati TaxID=131215 RepID=A0ACC2N7G8_9HYME|nr:hypothetical protein QAD02_008750 [Eretmocerus hayati]